MTPDHNDVWRAGIRGPSLDCGTSGISAVDLRHSEKLLMRGTVSSSLFGGIAAVLLIVLAATWVMPPGALAQGTDATPVDLVLGSHRVVTYEDDDDMTSINLAVDNTDVTEGDTITFTLTRVSSVDNLASSAIVGVSVSDPGSYLRGNHWEHAPAPPTSVEFAAGSETATFTLQTRDDWRDIPDNEIVVEILPESDYAIETGRAVTTVRDNDIAPQVSIGFEPSTAEEGQSIYLTFRRIGDDRNPIELSYVAGPLGSQEYSVATLDPGESAGQVRYDTIDDGYNGPDAVYEATLHLYDYPAAVQAEYWTLTGPATVSATVTDNDLPTVSLNVLDAVVQEGQVFRFQVLRDGYTDPDLEVEYNVSQEGSAMWPQTLGDHSTTIRPGNISSRATYVSRNSDGDDPTAYVIIELSESADYQLDPAPENRTALITVINSDPPPVASIGNATVDENDVGGSVDVEVTLKGLPSLRTITLDYNTEDGTAIAGEDYETTSGTLTFTPQQTTAVVTVPLVDDGLAESDESFTIVLSNPSHVTFPDGQDTLEGTVTLADDEPAVALAAVNDAILEGSLAEFTLTRTGDTTDELTVQLTLLTTAEGVTTVSQPAVSFAAGNDTAAYAIHVPDDSRHNDPRTFSARVLDPSAINQLRVYRPASVLPVTIVVRDDELPRVLLQIEERVINEGGTAEFRIRRTYGAESPGSVTVGITVVDSGNFLASTPPTSVTFQQDMDTVLLEFPTVNDSVVEPQGTITVAIQDGAGYTPGFPSTLDVIVQDDDSLLPEVRAGSSLDWVREGDDIVFEPSRKRGGRGG